MLKIPDHLFWVQDMRFLDRVAQDKAAYDAWLRYAIKKAGERRHGKQQRSENKIYCGNQ